jgi:hypothetical protein
MSLDYISIDNTAPKINLWQQYKKNDVILNFFKFLKTYWQTKYFDYLNNTLIPNLSVYNATSKYLYFFALNIFNIQVPIKIEGGTKYDFGLPYDSGYSQDTITGSVPVTFAEFKTILFFILDWSRPNWDIPTLFYLISKFTGLNWDDILIEQDSTNLDLITITLPSNSSTLLFELMMNYYKDIFGLPFAVSFVIILV